MNSLTDVLLTSKLSEKPTAATIDNIDYLFFKGKCWPINTILEQIYSVDTDVYATMWFEDTTLNELMEYLGSNQKLSICKFSTRHGYNIWVPDANQELLLDEFILWLKTELNFEIIHD